MPQGNTPINFKLIGIKTDQFAIIENSHKQGQQSQVSVSFNFKLDTNQRIISTTAQFKFEQAGLPFIILDISCNFQIEDNSWKAILDSETNLKVPKGFATHLAIIAVGTARGILHSKLENTAFNQYLLPTIDLSSTFKDDIVVSKQPEIKEI